MRTLTRDRCTFRVCAVRVGLPSLSASFCARFLQDFRKDVAPLSGENRPQTKVSASFCARFLQGFRKDVATEKRGTSTPKPPQNNPKIDPNSTKMAPKVVPGTRRKKQTQKSGNPVVKWTPFWTPKKPKKNKNARKPRGSISPARPLRGVVSKIGRVPEWAPSGPHFARPGGPRGSILAPRGPSE